MMKDKQIKKYCDGLDCAMCDEKEPCIYRIANELEQKLSVKEKECEKLKTKSEEQSYRYAELDADCERINLTNERLVQEKYDLHQDILKLKAENIETRKRFGIETLINEETGEKTHRSLEVLKLREALKEVKEIAEAITNGTHFSDDVELHLKEMVKIIIEKINEVENDK